MPLRAIIHIIAICKPFAHVDLGRHLQLTHAMLFSHNKMILFLF